jgi:purine-binding chemotaxis protein CheW
MDADEDLADEFDENSDYVTFDMAGERYAFPMRRVQEIIRMPAVVKVPLGPPSLEGLANLRGRVLPVVSLRRCCAMDQTGHDETTRVIVVDGGVPLGFVVDRVSSVISIDPRQVDPAESVQATVRSDVLVGVIKSDGGGMITVLDVDRLIGSRLARLSEKRAGRDSSAATRVSAEPDADAGPDDTLELVSFAVEGQEYALPIDHRREDEPDMAGEHAGAADGRGDEEPFVVFRLDDEEALAAV